MLDNNELTALAYAGYDLNAFLTVPPTRDQLIRMADALARHRAAHDILAHLDELKSATAARHVAK